MLAKILRLAAALAASTGSAAEEASASAPGGGAHTVGYDARSMLLDGERVLLLSGSLHYQRIVPADWPRVLALAVELNLNTISTYVFWDEHEAVKGNVSFAGRNDLAAFTALAGGFGLRVVVRIGECSAMAPQHARPLWVG